MSQFVDQRDVGLAGQHGGQIHLGEVGAAVLDRLAWHALKALDQIRGVAPAMGLDETDDDVSAALAAPPALAEHGVGLPDARRRAEIDPQMPACRRHGVLSKARDQNSPELGEGTVQLHHIHPWFAEKSQRTTAAVLLDQFLHPRLVHPRLSATRATWITAYAGLMSGSSPLPLPVKAFTGTALSWHFLETGDSGTAFLDPGDQVGVVGAEL